MPSILESVAIMLGQGDTSAKLGSLIGGDAKQAETAVETAGPALLGGLSETASAPGGPAAVAAMLDRTDTSILDDPGAFVDGMAEAGDDADTSVGEGILDNLFGGDRGALLDGLASRSGLGAGMFAKLLPVLAPLFLGVVGRRRDEDGLDADGLAGLVAEERDGLETDGKLGDWFSNLLVGGGALGAAAALGSRAKDKVGDLADSAEDALDNLKDRITGDDDGDGDDDDDDDHDDDVAASPRVAASRDSVAAVAAARSGMPGWIRWAIGAGVAVAVLALALSQCGGDDGTVATGDPSTVTDVTVDATAAGEDAEAEEAPDGPTTTEGEAGTTAEVTEPEPTTSTTGTSTTVPTTVDVTDVGAAVQAALQAADLGTGIVASFADGVVTLTGSVETDEARAAAEAAVGAVEGVTSVVNEVVVEAAAPVPAASGSSLNDTLGLDPVTFRYLSARITPEGETVLAEVITYLQANPGNVEVQGHTDSDGSEAKNLVLSQARADSVKAYLAAAGIDANRLSTVGLGESSPKVANDSASNKAVNRRIEFVLR